MKQLLLIIVTALLLTSCKKDSIISETPALDNTVASRNPPSGDCGYVTLTQNAQGQWQAYFGNVLVKFSNLHIYYDGRLYGRLESAENYPLTTGHEGIPSREFAFEKISCSGSWAITKDIDTVMYSEFINNANGNTTYLFYQNGLSTGLQFDMYAQELVSGVMTYNGTYKYTQTRYVWNTGTSCTGTTLSIGKLVAKNVVQNANGTFTATEYGIAPLCYVDQPVGWYIPELEP